MIYISFHENLEYFRNSNFKDFSPVKIPLSFTPPPNEHQELENIYKQAEHTPINIRKSKDKLMNLRKGLQLLLEKTSTNKIINEQTKDVYL